MTITCTDNFTDPGVFYNDTYAPPSALSLRTLGLPLVTRPPRDQPIVYIVSDGTLTASITRYVTITDAGLPVITLNGPPQMTLLVGETYTELGATAFDECYGNLTDIISIETPPQLFQGRTGLFTVWYSVSDAAFNVAYARRSVQIVQSTTASLQPNSSSTTTLSSQSTSDSNSPTTIITTIAITTTTTTAPLSKTVLIFDTDFSQIITAVFLRLLQAQLSAHGIGINKIHDITLTAGSTVATILSEPTTAAQIETVATQICVNSSCAQLAPSTQSTSARECVMFVVTSCFCLLAKVGCCA